MQCNDRLIQRYYHILMAYLAIAKQLENCTSEDKEFYQDVCSLFATKIKDMQVKLADQGFVLCKGRSKTSSPCENEAKESYRINGCFSTPSQFFIRKREGDFMTVIILDAGHGGRDPGTSGYGLLENDLALNIAKKVQSLLSESDITVQMTRKTDK